MSGLISWSWWGAIIALFWAGLVRIAVLHHVTFGQLDLPHDRWPPIHHPGPLGELLAIVSFGESWHNLHHADPTCARHGVLRGQIDISARLIGSLGKLG